MKDLMSEFASICQELAQFRTLAGEAQASSWDEATRAYLTELNKALDQTFAEVKRTMPQALTALQSEKEQFIKSAGQAEAKVEALRQKLADLKAARAEPAATPEPPPPTPAAPEWTDASIDADLRQYRLELLDLLTDGKKKNAGRKPADESREIWQDWSKYKEP